MSKNNPLAGEKLTLKRFQELRHISIQAPGRSIEVFEKFLKLKKTFLKIRYGQKLKTIKLRLR
jgi:hypothetical protein